MCGPVKLVIQYIIIYIYIYTLTLRTCKKKPRVTSKPGFAMKTWGFEKSRLHQSLPANLWCHKLVCLGQFQSPKKGCQNQLKINKPWASSEGPYLWFEGSKSWPKSFDPKSSLHIGYVDLKKGGNSRMYKGETWKAQGFCVQTSIMVWSLVNPWFYFTTVFLLRV